MTETIEGTLLDSEEWVPVPEAARIAGVAEGTIHRWCRLEKVEFRETRQGQRESRMVRRASLSASGAVCHDQPESEDDRERYTLALMVSQRHMEEIARCQTELDRAWQSHTALQQQLSQVCEALRHEQAVSADLRDRLAASEQKKPWWCRLR